MGVLQAAIPLSQAYDSRGRNLRQNWPNLSLKNPLLKTLLNWTGSVSSTPDYGEKKKTDKEKSHKGIWQSDAPEASQGQTQDVPATPGTFGPDLCVNQY